MRRFSALEGRKAPKSATCFGAMLELASTSDGAGAMLELASTSDGAGAVLELASTSDAGRYYVASRAISQGETVLTVRPSAWAPLWPCELSELSERELAVVKADPGPKPPDSEPPSDEEAGLKEAIMYDGSSDSGEEDREFVGSVSLYWLLAVRTALLARDSPDSFAAVQTLQDHGHERPRAQQAQLEAMGRRLSRALQMGAGVSLKAAATSHLLGALLVNAFGTRSGLFGASTSGEADGAGIFVTAAMFNHSCVPCCYADLSLRPRDTAEDGGSADNGGSIVFVACRPIAQGEAVSISYLDTSEPTHVRQRLLRRTKHFVCRCALCVDADEGGRRGGLLRCPTCACPATDGATATWCAPSPPPPARPTAWVCARCGGASEAAQVWALDAILRRRLRHAGVGPEAAPQYERIERAVLGAGFHPNHALVLQCRLARLAYCVHGAAADAADAARRCGLAEAALATATALLEPFDAQKAELLFKLGSWRQQLGALSPPRSDEARAAYHAGGAALLESARQFAFVCGKDAKPTVAARELAALCMRSLKLARAGT